MKLIDLHCDTLLQIKKQGASLRENSFHISLKKAQAFKPYVQVCAVWSDSSLSDSEAWQNFFQVTDHIKEVDGLDFIRSRSQLCDTVQANGTALILACEGARLLSGKIDRLYRLYDEGVRFLTLTWAGSDIIGGAHDTNDPLTDFGREVVEKCCELGIVPDVSHASRAVIKEVIEITKRMKKSPVATHSNSFTQHSHQRNLTDEDFSAIISLGGIVGVSLAPQHLSADNVSHVEDVVRHIKHYVNVCGTTSVALGCDFDGINSTPAELTDISCLPLLFDALVHSGLSEEDAENIFFKNAYKFLKENL